MFAHNDALPANMIRSPQGRVRLIDLEYSGPNPAAYDIATVLVLSVGADLASMDYGKDYPTEEEVGNWLSAYLIQLHNRQPTQVSDLVLLISFLLLLLPLLPVCSLSYFILHPSFSSFSSCVGAQVEVEQLRGEVESFIPVSLLVWSTWSVLQVWPDSKTFTIIIITS